MYSITPPLSTSKLGPDAFLLLLHMQIVVPQALPQLQQGCRQASPQLQLRQGCRQVSPNTEQVKARLKNENDHGHHISNNGAPTAEAISIDAVGACPELGGHAITRHSH